MIYFLQDRDDRRALIKIGYSSNLPARMKVVAREEGKNLAVLAAVPGDYEQETFFHKRFAEWRVRGEWFEASDDLLALIRIFGVAEGEDPTLENDLRASLQSADADLVNECVQRLRALVEAEMGGPTDTVDACLRRIGARAGIPKGVLWSLRYRPASMVTAATYARLLLAAKDAAE